MPGSKTLMQINAALKEGDTPGALLRATCASPRAQQEAVLADILSYAADCAYGKRYRFANIAGYEAFVQAVPVTEFSDYDEAIAAMKDGALYAA